jgi:hypothetical protein
MRRHLLEGSIRRAGSRVRIVAQLIDAETDRHLWAETYDRDLTDIFAIQSDVALRIAGALEAELSHEEGDPDQEAAHRRRAGVTSSIWMGRHCLGPMGPTKGLFQGHHALRAGDRRATRDYALGMTAVLAVPSTPSSGLVVVAVVTPAWRKAFRKGEGRGGHKALEDSIPYFPMRMRCWRILKMSCDYDWTGAEGGIPNGRSSSKLPSAAFAYDLRYGLMLSSLGRYGRGNRGHQESRAHELTLVTQPHWTIATKRTLRAGRYR